MVAAAPAPTANGHADSEPLSVRALQPPVSGASSPKAESSRAHLYRGVPKHALKADGTPDYLKLMLTSRVYECVTPTPLTHATALSAKLGCTILFKREDLQPVFSFKIRGAYNKMASLSEEERWRGVIACSAGNHAQGVALAGHKLGIACTIVMPLNTPAIKWVNVERLGATVVLFGNDFDEAKRECARLEAEHGLTNIPPFDDPHVIAGQGTAAVELMRQTDPSTLDGVFACVGGGGLLAGTALYVKAIAPPGVQVIGVETNDGDAMTRSLAAGRRVTLDTVGLFCEGTAVRLVGEETFRLCSELVDGMLSVSNDQVCAAIKDIFDDTRSVPEPAGALAVAGLTKYIHDHNLVGSGKRFVAFVSGANMNFDRLRFVTERAELGERREALISVEIPQRPGSFLKLASHIIPRAVTEFSYRFAAGQTALIICSFYLSAGAAPGQRAPPPSAVADPTSASDAPLSTIEARKRELTDLIATLERDGMHASDLGDNELAKSHARYLVGGRSTVPNERVFRFEFPERPGALLRFLEGLQAGGVEGDWNLSLFHYRNHGGDLGKILAGIQVPPRDNAAFEGFLQQLGYTYVEETSNVVYRSFLASDAS